MFDDMTKKDGDIRKTYYTSFHILKIVQQYGPIWKNKVYKKLKDDFGEKHVLGRGNTMASVQTVGRHIDEMQDQGFIEPCVTEPDELKRDLILAFTITDKGEQALKRALICPGDGCNRMATRADKPHEHNFISFEDYLRQKQDQ